MCGTPWRQPSARAIQFFVLGLALQMPGLCADTPPHYRTVLEAVRYRESLIENLSGELLHQQWIRGTPNEERPMLYMVRFLLADARARFSATCLVSGTNPWQIQPNVRGPLFELPGIDHQVAAGWPTSEVVRDGRRELAFWSWVGQGYVRPQATTARPTKWPPFCDYLLFGNSGSSAAELMEMGARGSAPAYAGTENVRGTPAHLVVCRIPDDGDEWVCRFWVCQDKGWAVVQSEHCLTAGATGRVTKVDIWTATELEEVATGIWLPLSSEGHTFRYGTDGSPPWVSTTIVTFSGLEANQPLAEDAFEYHFPPGTLVMDSVAGEVAAGFGESGDQVLRRLQAKARPQPPQRYDVAAYVSPQYSPE